MNIVPVHSFCLDKAVPSGLVESEVYILLYGSGLIPRLFAVWE